MAELVHSVSEIGLLQPVVVRRRRSGEDRYELIMGERRWRATQEAGLDTIPAIVRETGDDVLLRDALLENLHRSRLNPLEEAAAYQQLLDDFGCTHEELAGRIGRAARRSATRCGCSALPGRAAPGRRRRAVRRARAGPARRRQRRHPGPARRPGRGRGHLGARPRGDRGGRRPRLRVRPPARRNKPTAPALADLAARLSDRLETRVKVDLGKSRARSPSSSPRCRTSSGSWTSWTPARTRSLKRDLSTKRSVGESVGRLVDARASRAGVRAERGQQLRLVARGQARVPAAVRPALLLPPQGGAGRLRQGPGHQPALLGALPAARHEPGVAGLRQPQRQRVLGPIHGSTACSRSQAWDACAQSGPGAGGLGAGSVDVREGGRSAPWR